MLFRSDYDEYYWDSIPRDDLYDTAEEIDLKDWDDECRTWLSFSVRYTNSRLEINMRTEMTELNLIDKLFVEAGGVVEYEGEDRFTYSSECDPELFAELIIKECSKICTLGNIETPMGLYYSKQIKKHFGVE